MSSTQPTGQRTNGMKDYEAALDDIAERGAAAIRSTKSRIDETMTKAADKGQEALDGARDVRDTMADAILRSVRTRPYTTLAIAGFIGFLCGALRRR
jgi:ElaB/YqjD/DUF883 family membrane-anchored ribosome-binding protein